MHHFRSRRRILLTCTLVVAATAGIARGETWDPLGIHNHYYPFGPNGPELTVPSPTKILNGGSLGQANRRASHYHTVSQNDRVARRNVISHTSRFDDLNLSVAMPSGPWVKLDPKKTGSHACLLLSRTNPTIMISLAGEPVGIEGTDTNNSLLAESQDKMRGLPGATIEPGEQQLSAGGIDGLAYQARVAAGEATTYYSLWVAAHHGYVYKLAVYGDQTNQPAIDAAMHDFLLGIKQIQSNRVARTGGNQKTVTR